MATSGKGIAETQNRQTNLINLSPMFAHRVLNLVRGPMPAAACRCCVARTIAMMRLRGCAN